MGNKLYKYVYAVCCLLLLLQSCSVSKQINKQAKAILLQNSIINTGHIGISIYEPATNRYWYNYNAEKYFVPASNVKLFTLYAGMKYLGDSLVGLRYSYPDYKEDRYKILVVAPSGDPTFLHPDFKKQPVLDFLKNDSSRIFSFCIFDTIWKEKNLGLGWAWDDYGYSFMTERSSFPFSGNNIKIKLKPVEERNKLYESVIDRNDIPYKINHFWIEPSFFDSLITSDIMFDASFLLAPVMDSSNKEIPARVEITREQSRNKFSLLPSNSVFSKITIPFHNEPDNNLQRKLLSDILNKRPLWTCGHYKDSGYQYIVLTSPGAMNRTTKILPFKTIHSQPADSLFTPMMHNSDNFFAEQTLLMASNEHLGYMNDEAIIDTLLKTDLKDVPQQPRWVDGSGLSRYNLFTPQSFVYILNKMKSEFGWERLKTILPTGGEGTLKNYYQADSGFVYAKTGSLSNQIALSGFLITRQNKLLVFSLLTNNAIGEGWRVRRAYESFLKAIRENY